MKCPTCGTWTTVLETRTRSDGNKYRRYECANLHRFLTMETVKIPLFTKALIYADRAANLVKARAAQADKRKKRNKKA